MSCGYPHGADHQLASLATEVSNLVSGGLRVQKRVIDDRGSSRRVRGWVVAVLMPRSRPSSTSPLRRSDSNAHSSSRSHCANGPGCCRRRASVKQKDVVASRLLLMPSGSRRRDWPRMLPPVPVLNRDAGVDTSIGRRDLSQKTGPCAGTGLCLPRCARALPNRAVHLEPPRGGRSACGSSAIREGIETVALVLATSSADRSSLKRVLHRPDDA